MAKTIKFNLICDNTPVRTIEDLQNNFSIEDVLNYYRNGLLCRWLEVRGYDEQLKKVKAIRATDSMDIIKELIAIFEISCDMKKVEEYIYILKYQVEEQLQNDVYEKEGYQVDTIIEDYRQGYSRLINSILGYPNNAAKIKAAIQEIVFRYKWVLQYDYRRVLKELIDQKMTLAVMCFLMNEQAREICFAPDPKKFCFAANSDNSILYISICDMLSQKECMDSLGDNLLVYCGATEGYWKDLKPKGKKYMLLHLGEGDFVRSAGVVGGDMRASNVNNQFVIVDGIDYKSNSDIRTLWYMEV